MDRILRIIALFSLLVGCSCDRIDYTNPEKVYLQYTKYLRNKHHRKAYSLLSLESKKIISENEFINYQNDNQGSAVRYRYLALRMLSGEDTRYKRIQVEDRIINGNDTTKVRYYSTFELNDNKWLLAWTSNLQGIASKYFNNLQYDDAKREYYRILDIDPYNGRACDGLAWSYFRDNPKGAKSGNDSILYFAQKSIKIEPDIDSHYGSLSLYYNALEEYGLSIKCYENQLKHIINKYDSVQVLSNIGLGYMNLRQYNKSREYFNKALLADSQYAHALWQLGSVHKRLNQPDTAFVYLHKAYISPPMDDFLQVQMLYDLALVSYQLKKYDIAEESILKGLDIEPGNPNAQNLYKKIMGQI